MPAVLLPALDLVVVIVFATIGRRNHGEGDALTGVLTTAWPFAVGAIVGWLLLLAMRRLPGSSLTSGVVVWLSTVAFGMLLRHFAGRGVAMSFIIVALVFTGACMLGWRLVASALARRSRREA